MDPFSQLVGLLKPQAVFWRVVQAHDAWTIAFRPTNVVVFGQMIEGVCHVEREDGISFHLEAGDFMLMAAPPNWTMAAFGGSTATDYCSRPLTQPRSHASWRETSNSKPPIVI